MRSKCFNIYIMTSTCQTSQRKSLSSDIQEAIAMITIQKCIRSSNKLKEKRTSSHQNVLELNGLIYKNQSH